MTASGVPTVPWYARGRVVLPSVAGLLLALALLSPEPSSGRRGDARLSSYNAGSLGARIAWQLAQRLGWRVSRQESPGLPRDARAVVALLGPAVPPRTAELHALLQHVRGGGGLFAVLREGGDPLGDSLGIAIGQGGLYVPNEDENMLVACPPDTSAFQSLWADKRARLFRLSPRRPWPAGMRVFTAVTDDRPPARGDAVVIGGDSPAPRVHAAGSPAMIGFPLGAGHVVVAADPDVMRNDALRYCRHGLDVPLVRALEYLRDSGPEPRTRIVFDEYHQGYGLQPGSVSATTDFLAGTRPGRTIFQLLGAGLVLLLAVAPRLVPPHDPVTIERRSPLEHVDALARAYAQVGATRTATLRLLRGVRRRVERGVRAPAGSDADLAFLARAEDAEPARQGDVALIRRALRESVPRRTFADVGAALHRLETSFTRH